MSVPGRPPRLLEACLRACVGRSIGTLGIERDLRDEYARRAVAHGRMRTNGWYLRCVFSLATHRKRLAFASPNPALDPLRGVHDLLRDLQFSARAFRRAPAVTATILVVLTLGIAGATTVFSLLDGIVLRPLPYVDESSLVRVRHLDSEHSAADGNLSPQDYEDLRARTRTLSDLSAYWWNADSTQALGGADETEYVETAFVFAGFFETLGVSAARGRLFDAADFRPGNDDVVVIGHQAWLHRFAADPDIVGRQILLDGETVRIVGVLPARATYPSDSITLWQPESRLGPGMIPRRRDIRWLGALGRLAPGNSIDSARAELDGLATDIGTQHPTTNATWTRTSVEPLRAELFANVRPATVLLFAATALLLAMACANAGGLLITQASRRQREIAIRTALGAQRGRIARQLLTESVALGVLAAALGLGVAHLTIRGVVLSAPALAISADAVTLGPRLAFFAMATALATSVAFGSGPALVLGRIGGGWMLRTTQVGEGQRGRRAQAVLGVSQIALALALVVGSLLAVSSLRALLRLDSGFDSGNVTVVGLRLDPDMPLQDMVRQRREMIEAVGRIPGVTSVAGSKTGPLSAGGEAFPLTSTNAAGEASQFQPEAGVLIVTRDYFDTLGMRFVAGRGFRAGDPMNTIVLNASLARQRWPDRDPVGDTVQYGGADMLVLGVVEDARHDGMAASPRSAAYLLDDRFPRLSVHIYARNAAGSMPDAAALRDAIRSVNAAQPIESIVTLDAVIDADIAPQRFLSQLVSGFAGFALLLAALGVYGVVSAAAYSRQREFGLRLALGAGRGSVLRTILKQAIVLGAAGVAVGAAGAWWTGRALGGLLYGIEAGSAGVTVLAVGVILVVTLVAGLPAALRASRSEPLDMLRHGL